MRRNSLDMTQGPILRKLILFALPLLFNFLLNSFYNTADKIILGRFVGDNAMAAAGVTNAPFNLLYNLFAGFALGALVCCGNYLGARKRKELEDCMHTALCAGFYLGLIITVIGLPLSRPLLVAVGAPQEVLSDALIYFRIRFLATPISLTNTFVYNIMTAFGDTRRMMFSGMASGLLNVLLNLLLVVVIPMGVAGVALATALSSAFSLAWRLCWLFSPNGEYRLTRSALRIDWAHLRDLLRIGIPNGLNSTVFTISNVLLQSTVNSFGAVFIAANSAADSVSDYAGIAYAGFPSACIAAVSQCYGAKKYERIDKVMQKSILGCLAMVAAMDVIVVLFARPLLGMFTTTQEVVEAGVPKLMYYCGGYLIHTFGQIYTAGIKGLKKSGAALFVNLFGVCAPRVLWVLLVIPHMHTPTMLYLIYPISWLISAVLLGAAYHYYRSRLPEAAVGQ